MNKRPQLGRTRQSRDYGYGHYKLALHKTALMKGDEMAAYVLSTFRSPTFQPPQLPSVALELMELSRKPDVDIDQILQVLEQDAVLAGEFLKIANSPLFRTREPVRSLRKAVLNLGLRRVRDTALHAAMNTKIFRVPSYTPIMERLSTHSTLVANIASTITHYTSFESEYAYLCGLLHDVGIAGILMVMAEKQRGEPPPEFSTIWPAIETAHAKVGAELLKLWKMPHEIQLIVENHHNIYIDGYPHPMTAMLCMAEAIAETYGGGILPTHSEPTLETLVPFQAESSGIDMELVYKTLGLTSHHVHQIHQTLEKNFNLTESDPKEDPR